MDRESLWTRRSRQSADNTKTDTLSNSSRLASKRFSTGGPGDAPARSTLSNGVTPLNTNTNTNATAPPGASSAFGLGSGAFASFGSATKTPKTPGTAFDFKQNSVSSPIPESAKAKSSSNSIQSQARSQAEQQHSNSGGPAKAKAQWPLKSSWTLWYRPPTPKTSDYEKSIKPMFRFGTAPDFWRVYAHLKRPSALPTVSDYHLFREGIRPVWEDEENKRGGKWIMRLRKGVIDRYWEELLMAIVGDRFGEAGEELCGCVVSVRGGEDVLSVWTKFDSGRNVKIRETIKHTLDLPADTILVWKSHDDSIAQRSAIDQARLEQQKVGTGGGDRRAGVDRRKSGLLEQAAGSQGRS